MAHIFSDSDGNIGTIIVLKGHPTDYLDSNEHTYHGDHEIPEGAVREALEFGGGILFESVSKLKVIKKREAEERHDGLREELRKELHDAMLDDVAVEDIKAKAVQLKANKDKVIADIDRKLKVDTVKAVDHLSFTHEV